MAWAFDVTAGIPRITQSGTDANIDGIATAITAQAVVARSTAYAVTQMVKPPTPTGFWYKCTTAGTTAATAPVYGTTDAGTTTDGTAVFTAFKAPDVQTLGTKNHYYMPAFRFNITGTLTNPNPQIANFTCWDLYLSAAGTNFTSGSWAADGVTPLYDGLHFACVRSGANNADNVTMQLQIGSLTLIGGEVQLAGACSFAANTTPRSYYTRWRGTKQWGGVSSSRFRSYSANAIFRGCEFYDIAYDLFQMPAEFSAKARKCEYVAQYVGAFAGGVDAYFKASALENIDGVYDFDNYAGGYVELFNCKLGVNLRVVTQLGTSLMCTPLYQDLIITAKDSTGAVVQNVRFTATDAPTNSPTTTISTRSNLKTWDFRNPLTYQTTTNASGIALSSPIIMVSYFATTLKKNIRFSSGVANYQGRAYNYKTMTVSMPAVDGQETARLLDAGMISLDTATTVTEAVAGAITGITLTPSGATGGLITVSSNHTLQDIWNYYRWWISQFTNTSSNDTWSCIGGKLDSGAWSLVVNTGIAVTGDSNISSYKTSSTVTNNGTITALYTDSTGASTIIEQSGVTNGSSIYVGNNATGVTKQFQANTATSTIRTYFAPNETADQLVVRELYGSQRVSQVVSLTGGLIKIAYVDIPDIGISEANKATVAAYSTLETNSKLKDYISLKRLEEAFIKLGEIAVRDGTSINFGNYSGKIKSTATALLNITGNLITVKANGLAGDSKYSTIVATPPATWTADTTENLTTNIEDGGGDSSVNITASGVSTFEVWKITDATNPDNYATGTLLGTVGIGKYRFLHADGYKMVIRDTTTNFRVVSEMEKGIYEAALFFGAAVQLAQAAEVTQINTKVDTLQVEISNVMQNFDVSYDSLHAISQEIQALPTLSAIEGSTVLAKESVLDAAKAKIDTMVSDVWSATSRTLTSAGASGATLAEIEASTVLAKESTSQAIKDKVDTLNNPDLSNLATHHDATVINDGVKAASLLIPHDTDL